MKKIKALVCVVLVFSFAVLMSACGGNKDDMVSNGSDSDTVQYKDGEYKASDGEFDDQGYKSTVEVVIRDGKIYSVDCDAEHQEDGTKKAHSESGKYNMKTAGAQYDWHEEIAFFEKHVVENGLEDIKLDSNGKTDAVTGCTISVDNYVKLINEALKKAEK